MKKILFGILIVMLAASLVLSACKDKEKADVTTAPVTTNGSVVTSVGDTTGLLPGTTTSDNGVVTTAATQTSGQGSVQSPDIGDGEYDFITVDPGEAYNGNLILVNKTHTYAYKLTSLYTPSELDSLSSLTVRELGMRNLYSEKTGDYLLRTRLLYMKSEAFEAFTSMMKAYKAKSGNGNVQVCYAYRLASGSKDNASLSDERVSGLVVEINVLTDEGTFAIEHTSKKAEYYDWFSKNAAHYGFIMTGDSGYFRYVGIPHAEYMKKSSLSLSEYLEKLREYSPDKPLSVKTDLGEYEVYYVKSSGASAVTIPILKGSDYSVSGDNSSGFIVTVKK